MSKLLQRCQVILCGHDYDRIKYALKYYRPNRVVLVSNQTPWPEHEVHDNEVYEKLKTMLEEIGFEKNEICKYPVNYYEFDKALTSLYKLFLDLKKQGYEVIANVTGGTKLLAAATVICCMLANVEPIYVAAEKYGYTKKTPDVVESMGVEPRPIEISPLFELSDALLPISEQKINILLFLLENEAGVKTVTEMTAYALSVKSGRTTNYKNIGEKIPSKEIAKYSYYLTLLQNERLVKEEQHRFFLTPIGRLVAQLVKVRKEVNSKK